MENLSYYFCEYDEGDDEYVVYFGSDGDDFSAAWIASFIREEDANEYVDIKNAQLDEQEPRRLDDSMLLDPEWDEQTADDLIEKFAKEHGEFRD